MSPIFKVKQQPTATISRPPPSPKASPTPGTSVEEKKDSKRNCLVDYGNSLDDEPDIVNIMGVSSDSDSRFKTPVSATELKNLGGKMFAASTDRKISWAKKLFDDWKCEQNEFNECGSIRVNLDADVVDKSELSAALCQFLAEVR